MELPIHLDPLEAQLAVFEHFLAILALAVAHHGREQIGARAFFQRHDAVHHVLDLLGFNGQARGRAVGRARAREQQAQVVVNLGHSAHSRARVLRRGFLLDADRGRQARDMVHVGLLHHVQKLPGIGRQAFDIAPLPFGIDRVKGQRRLARARQAREHHQLVARNIQIDILQVMLARAAHFDELLLRHPAPPMLLAVLLAANLARALASAKEKQGTLHEHPHFPRLCGSFQRSPPAWPCPARAAGSICAWRCALV